MCQCEGEEFLAKISHHRVFRASYASISEGTESVLAPATAKRRAPTGWRVECKLAPFRTAGCVARTHHLRVRIITLNVNGIRSAERKGLARWLARAEPWDIVCLQEVRAAHGEIPRPLRAPRKAHAAFHPAGRKGYAGVAVYAKAAPQVATGFGSREFDGEGRYLEAHFPGLTVISVYFPSGSSGPHRQASKFRFLAEFLPHLAKLREAKRNIVLCGDWNIAHREIDLRNWRGNQKNSGFLPEERAWLTQVLDQLGFVDVFRHINKGPDQYTWW